VLVILFIISSYGCATVINGTTQKISVDTGPCGADCQVVGDSARYTTPCQLELKRKEDHLVKITKESYEPETVDIKHSMSGVVVGNVLLGGLIGVGVDAADGAACKLTPEKINITMKAIPQPEPALEAQPVTVAPEPPQAKSKSEQLEELDQLKKEGKISKKEYKSSREKILQGE